MGLKYKVFVRHVNGPGKFVTLCLIVNLLQRYIPLLAPKKKTDYYDNVFMHNGYFLAYNTRYSMHLSTRLVGWLVGIRGSPDPGTIASPAPSGASSPNIFLFLILNHTYHIDPRVSKFLMLNWGAYNCTN